MSGSSFFVARRKPSLSKRRAFKQFFFRLEELLHSLKRGQEEIVITEHKRKARQPGVRAEMIAALPVEVERCIVDPEEQCPVCKSPLIKVGEKAVRTEVIFQPAQLKVRQSSLQRITQFAIVER